MKQQYSKKPLALIEFNKPESQPVINLNNDHRFYPEIHTGFECIE